MRKVLIKSGFSIAAILIAIPVAVLIWRYPAIFGEYPLVGDDDVVGVNLQGDPYLRNNYVFQVGSGGSSNEQFSMSVWEMHIDILRHGTKDLELSNPSTGSLDW